MFFDVNKPIVIIIYVDSLPYYLHGCKFSDMPEVQVFHDKLHHVLLLNYVEKWFQLQFSGFSKFSTCTHVFVHNQNNNSSRK